MIPGAARERDECRAVRTELFVPKAKLALVVSRDRDSCRTSLGVGPLLNARKKKKKKTKLACVKLCRIAGG